MSASDTHAIKYGSNREMYGLNCSKCGKYTSILNIPKAVLWRLKPFIQIISLIVRKKKNQDKNYFYDLFKRFIIHNDKMKYHYLFKSVVIVNLSQALNLTAWNFHFIAHFYK